MSRLLTPSQIPYVDPLEFEAPEFEDDPLYGMLGMTPLGGIGGILAGTGRGGGSGSGSGSGEGPGQETGSGGGSGGEGSQGQDGAQPGGDSGGWDFGGIWDINWPWPYPEAPQEPVQTTPEGEPGIPDPDLPPELGELDPPPPGGTGAPGGGGGSSGEPAPRPWPGTPPYVYDPDWDPVYGPQEPPGGGGSQGREYEWDPFGFGGAIYGYPGVYGGDPSESRDWGQVAQGIGGLVGAGEGGPSPFGVAKGVWDIVSGLGNERNVQQSKQANAMLWNQAQERELQSFFDAAQAADPTWDGTLAGAEQALGMPVPQWAIIEDPFKIVGGDVATNQAKYNFSRDQGWRPQQWYTPQIDPRIIEMYGASSYYDTDLGGFDEGFDEQAAQLLGRITNRGIL